MSGGRSASSLSRPARAGLALSLLLVGLTARGEVRWKELVLERTAAPETRMLEFPFEFTNTGDHPVSIISAKPSCGCTTIQGGKAVYAPGEKGVITALMDLSGKLGDDEKTVAVTFSDAPQVPVLLTLRLRITPPAALSAAELVWAVGGAAEEKTVTVNLAGKGLTVGLSPLTAAQKDLLEAGLTTDPETGAHTLKVRPLDTSRPRLLLLRLNATSADGRSLPPLTLQVRIR
jgi:hypothetical protein